MEKRSKEEMAQIRAALQPGVCFEIEGGAIGKVVVRESGEDGVRLTCTYAGKRMVKTSSSALHFVAGSVVAMASLADFDAASEAVNALKAAKKPAVQSTSPAPLSLKALADRIAKLEAEVSELRTRRIASVATKTTQLDPECRLYIGNIPYDVDDDELRAALLTAGATGIVGTYMPRDTEAGLRSRRNRGFAFVAFTDQSSAQAALNALRGFTLAGRAVIVTAAEPRNVPMVVRS